jgi:hypothetical protein
MLVVLQINCHAPNAIGVVYGTPMSSPSEIHINYFNINPKLIIMWVGPISNYNVLCTSLNIDIMS